MIRKILIGFFIAFLFAYNSYAVNVKDYGAIGDCSVNDTQSVLNAYVISKDLYFPSGCYVLSVSLTGNNTTVHGDGTDTVLRSLSSGDTPILTISGYNGKVENLTVEPYGNFYGRLIYGSNADMLSIYNVIFNGTQATHIYSFSIETVNSDEIDIDRNIFYLSDKGWDALRNVNGQDAYIGRNKIYGGRNYGINNGTASDNTDGAVIEKNKIIGTTAHGIITHSGNQRIVFNTVKDAGGAGIFTTRLSSDIDISHNTISNPVGVGINLENGISKGKVQANTVSGAYHGISAVRNIHDIQISGNIIIGSNIYCIASFLFQGEPNSGFSVTDNICGGDQIFLESTTGSLIDNNL